MNERELLHLRDLANDLRAMVFDAINYLPVYALEGKEYVDKTELLEGIGAMFGKKAPFPREKGSLRRFFSVLLGLGVAFGIILSFGLWPRERRAGRLLLRGTERRAVAVPGQKVKGSYGAT